MEKTERETHDFMNVESFSQLPFIRPAPIKEKGIRLFGKEFGGGSGDSAATDDSADQEEVKENGEVSGESSRKFECHYCCRNFPTSQALGGHQNAHKRERQQAKRAHLQSAIVHGGLTDAHVYGLMNYHRIASSPSQTMGYHSWNHNHNHLNSNFTTNNSSSRFYQGSYSQPLINGSPLGLWRIPAVQNSASFNQDRSSHPLPLFANEELKPGIGGSASQSRYVYEPKPSVTDHVSLDLHL